MSLAKKILAGSIVLVVLAVAAGLVGVFLIAPSIAQNMVRDKLDAVESRLALEVETAAIDTTGLRGVEITDLTVKDPETGRTLATVGTVGAKVDVIQLIAGRKVIDAVWTEDVDVRVTRESDGAFDLLRVARRLRGDGEDSDEEEEPTEGGGLLRIFGGTLPEVDVSDVEIAFLSEPNAPPFPVEKLKIPTGIIEHGSKIEATTKVAVESTPSEAWTIPSEVDVALVLTEELSPETMTVKFDRPLELGGVGPLPFLRGGVAGIEIAPDKTITATDLHLGFQSNGETPFLETDRLSMQLSEWTMNPDELSLVEVSVDAPMLTLEYDRLGASALTDLDHAVRAPRARQVIGRARGMAENLAEEEEEEPEPLAPDDEVDDAPKPEKEQGDGRIARIINRLPHAVTISDGRVIIVDHRNLPVENPMRTLRLEKGNLELVHQPIQGNFKVDGSFDAIGDEKPRGSVEALLSFNYRNKKLDADVEIAALDLSWLGQLLGPSVAEYVRGGTLRAKVGVKPGEKRDVTLDGIVSVDDLVFFWGLLAEEPLRDFTASYSFTAKYDPDRSIPESKLLKTPLFKESNEPPADSPIRKGALVFTKGKGTVGDVQGDFVPAIYGTGALPGDLPARVDLHVDLPKTDTQALFDAVPLALQGPLEGTRLAGTFAWKLAAEIPLYRASDMQWESNPVLDEFEVVEMPKEVDPRTLMSGYDLTITDTLEDERGEEYEWSRTITIPPAKPVSAKYLVENSGLTIEQIDERRREREWPKLPDPNRSFLPRSLINSPQYWLTTHAEQRTAPKPWKSSEAIRRTKDRPYGPYVFVPLHHIARWVVLAVTTTEDGGFFTHPGFLFDAIKDSIEDNIESGRFRRGASTISMQMVKNAYLKRDKLIARKLREAFLVFLMETVFDVPKSRILEVYMNIIEFGPGIYGIHDASVHYFGKRPDKLTLGEVSWLFSVVPSPKRYHFYWKRGEISDRWWSHISRRIDIMYNREKITEAERDAAKAQKAEFYKPEDGDPVLRPEQKSIFDRILLFDREPSEDTSDDAADDTSPTPTFP
jgi:hypothetical protein